MPCSRAPQSWVLRVEDSTVSEPILPIRRIRRLHRAPETPGGPLALKDVLILVSILNLASCCENMNGNFF